VPEGCSGSQAVFGPSRTDLCVGCEFTACGRFFRRREGRLFVGRKRRGWRIICTRKLKHDAGNVILSGRRQTARDLEGLL
jgi:hypothetical protein